MTEFFNRLDTLETIFILCAVLGGGILLVRTLMMLAGLHHDTDAGLDTPADVHADAIDGGHAADHGSDTHHSDSDAGFKLLTIHGLTSFFLLFGLVGFALYRQSLAGVLLSLAGAGAAGLVTMVVMAKVFQLFGRLHSSGTIPTTCAVGCEGSVYLTIPAAGTGRVTVQVRNRLREFDAVSHHKVELKTGEPVRVVWVDGDTLEGERIES